jgi:phosphoesterase RecJ-like protein
MHHSAGEVDLLRSHRKFVLTTHISSDGDGVGSELALARGLWSLGCEVAVINPTPLPANLHFLLKHPKEIRILKDLRDPERFFAGALTVVLDMGAFDRLGGILNLARLSDGILVVDHHRMERVEGVRYLLNPDACATGEVTARILKELGIPLAPDLAEPLYVAIHTDTGGFRYPGVTPDTHRLVAELLQAGVDPQKVYTELYERVTALRLRLTGRILSTLRVSPQGRVAWIQVTQRMLQETGASFEDADDLVNYTLLIDGVGAGFYFKELGGGATKVSCRSRGAFPIDEFVSRWGGGGHPNAAGVRLDLPLAEAIDTLVPAALAAIGEKT